MNGYNKQDALPFILSHIDTRVHKELPIAMDELISLAIDLDLSFMRESGVIDEKGNAGDTFYDDDEAFEYLLDGIVSKYKLGADAAMKIASLLDDYMDAQQSFMEEKGLVDWE